MDLASWIYDHKKDCKVWRASTHMHESPFCTPVDEFGQVRTRAQRQGGEIEPNGGLFARRRDHMCLHTHIYIYICVLGLGLLHFSGDLVCSVIGRI